MRRPRRCSSDMLGANAIADVVCSTPASITAFVEHCDQAALAIIEQNNCSRRRRSVSCIGSLQLLQAVELGVEHGSWHAHSLIAIERTEFVDVSIRLAANNCQPIEKSEIQLAVLPAHCAPNVPRQHLTVVQSGDVADEVARNEPKSVHVEDAEGTRVGPSATAERPGIARDHELIPRDVCCIESDPEEFALAIVDL